MLSKKVNEALNIQIREELGSAYLYFSMASFFESKNLKGFAMWMKAQAGEEMVHVMKFFNYIIDRGGDAHFLPLKEPDSKWLSPLDAFKAAYKHEQYITGCINDLLAIAREERDNATEIMLQWFVTEQVEEEASADDVVSKLELIGDSREGLYHIDRELGARPLPPLGMAVLGQIPGA